MTLTDLFDLSLAGRADAVGLEFQGRSYTFGELDARSNRMARALKARGIRRLCVYLPNSVKLIDLYLACVKLGVIFVPINILYREREIDHIVRDAEPQMLVTSKEAQDLEREAGGCSAERPRVVLDGDAPAAIIYTSGTTGASKGAILTHNNFAANAANLITCWQITSADRLLLPLPLFHVHGLGNGLHTWLMAGYRMRLVERFEHQRAGAELLDFRPTLFFGVPAMYVRLLETPPEQARTIGAFVRLFVSGSAPLPPHVFAGFERLFGHRILERYGMSETLMNLSNPYVGERRPRSAGFPLPGVSVLLCDEEGGPAGDDAVGEIYVRGPNVFAGYWRNEVATRAAFANGYFRTGDLAVCSPDGYYAIVGRKSDMIISGGFNIYPREIEEFLLDQEGVAEVAVVGVPDAVRGEVPVAYIVPRSKLDTAALEACCRQKLASFKVPRAFIPVDTLPRTALGKVQKHLLPKWTPGS